jgi:S-adenosylmethionine:tRNA-ribosyltransferase-isomerase (queuine synthetase)
LTPTVKIPNRKKGAVMSEPKKQNQRKVKVFYLKPPEEYAEALKKFREETLPPYLKKLKENDRKRAEARGRIFWMWLNPDFWKTRKKTVRA